MKFCPRCKKEKEDKEFSSDKNTKDLLKYACKVCISAYMQEYSRGHKEQKKVGDKKYYEGHKEKWKVYTKNRKDSGADILYRQTHKDKIDIWRKNWYKLHPEKYSEYAAQRRVLHLDEIREKENQFRRDHKDMYNVYARKYQAKKYATEKGRIEGIMSSMLLASLKEIDFQYQEDVVVTSLVPYSSRELRESLIKTIPMGYTIDDFLKRKKNDPEHLEIDHIISRVVWNYNSPLDIGFQMCWSLSNLRFLPRKSNTYRRWAPEDLDFVEALSNLKKEFGVDPLTFITSRKRR